jgi:glycosyltransferase involved in cell wall biosynthesis
MAPRDFYPPRTGWLPRQVNAAVALDARSTGDAASDGDHVDVEIVLPVYNEEASLVGSVVKLHRYLTDQFPFSFHITIADNASTDGTAALADKLAESLPSLGVMHLHQKGRGRALKAAWLASNATVLTYMDIDLSTDLAALLPLVAPLLSGHSELAIGSRLANGSGVRRGAKRELISRCYNLILRTILRARFTDAQCGFKAVRRSVAADLLPLVADTGWFYDTELLILAERAGLRIHEVPVDWLDDPNSTVDLIPTILADLKGVIRVARTLAGRRIPLNLVRGHAADRPRSSHPLRMAKLNEAHAEAVSADAVDGLVSV